MRGAGWRSKYEGCGRAVSVLVQRERQRETEEAMGVAVRSHERARDPAGVPSMSGTETAGGHEARVGDVAGWRERLEGWAGRRVLQRIGACPATVIMPGGTVVRSDAVPSRAILHIRDGRVLLGLLGPSADLSFGDAYADGRIEVEGDLLALVESAFRAPDDGWLARAGRWWRGLPQRDNSLRRARANARQHYDLGNDFYALWLDREMVYTCAYFATPALSLEEAQVAKMEHVARKLRLRPEETVIEAGCGWGSLALHLARRHGV